MNNKEHYVDLETAKRLKKLGFRWVCHRYYNAQYDTARSVSDTFEMDFNDDEHMKRLHMDGAYSIPTLQMANQWLRETHKLHVDVDPSEGDWNPCVIELEDWTSVSGGITDVMDTYEEAYNVGINDACRYIEENELIKDFG